MAKQLHEINRYHDDAFPVGIYTVTPQGIVPDGRGYKDLHWHEELQLTLVTDKSMSIRIDNKDYTLQEGEAVFINRNLLHITTDLAEGGRYISLNFPDKLLGFFPGSRMEQDYVLPYTAAASFPAIILKPEISWQNHIISELREIIVILSDSSAVEIEYLISMKLTDIWFTLITNTKDQLRTLTKGELRRQERIRTMLSFIHNHYMEDIHLKEVAESANISEGECCRCFSRIISTSPAQYLLGYRIAKGMELLDRTSLSITEIALSTGFNDSSHFIQYFKQKTGKTPREYRHQNS